MTVGMTAVVVGVTTVEAVGRGDPTVLGINIFRWDHP